MTRDEFEQIADIRRRLRPDPRVAVGVGDDAAVLRPVAGEILVTVDMLLEDVHFELAKSSPVAVGRKAMNVNLSDIAAMAGIPLAAVVAVGLPSGRAPELADELFVGLKQAADRFDVAIVGGDTNRSRSGLVIAVTLMGRATSAGPTLRTGALPGDAVCVTGELGYSLAGKHLHFTPRVAEALRLRECCDVHAMMDLSDGLGSDLFHLTRESRVGAIIRARELPIALGADDGRSPIDHALNDGEDFELLFATPMPDARRLLADQPLADLGVRISIIGEATADLAVLLQSDAGLAPLPRGGFSHQW